MLPFVSFVADSLEGHRLLSPSGRFLFRSRIRGGDFPESCRPKRRKRFRLSHCGNHRNAPRQTQRFERWASWFTYLFFMKPGARDTKSLTLAAFLGLGEPAAAKFLGRNAGHVRLDIENWSAIEHIDAMHVQLPGVAAQQFNNSERNGIWASRRTGREDTVRPLVKGRAADQFKAF